MLCVCIKIVCVRLPYWSAKQCDWISHAIFFPFIPIPCMLRFIIVLHMKKAAQMFASSKDWIRFVKINLNIIVESHKFLYSSSETIIFYFYFKVHYSPESELSRTAITLVYSFFRDIWSLIGWEYDFIKNSCMYPYIWDSL